MNTLSLNYAVDGVSAKIVVTDVTGGSLYSTAVLNPGNGAVDGIPENATILYQVSGTPGGAGTYVMSSFSTTEAAGTLTNVQSPASAPTSVAPPLKLTAKLFSGTSKVFDGTLASILRTLAANQAIAALVHASVAQLTDNGGGTANGAFESPLAIQPHALTGNDSAAKADVEAAFGTVRDAVSEVIYKLNQISPVIPAFGTLVDDSGGASATGTVAAITQTVAGANASLVSYTGFMAVYAALYAEILQASLFVNQVAVATGIAPIALPATQLPTSINPVQVNAPIPVYSTTFAAVSTGTGTAVSGADALANATVAATDADSVLAQLANGVKELTAKLQTILAATTTVSVIAA